MGSCYALQIDSENLSHSMRKTKTNNQAQEQQITSIRNPQHTTVPSVSIASDIVGNEVMLSSNEQHQSNDSTSNSDDTSIVITQSQNINIIDECTIIWQCPQCTLVNNMNDTICQVCEYPHHTEQPVESEETEPHYVSYTSDSLCHEKSWLCSSCYAMNRLIDTIYFYKMKCAICDRLSYSPGITEILMSFEWDHKLHSYNTSQHEKQQNDISKTPGKLIVPKFVQINSQNWHIFMMGLVRRIYKNNIPKFEIELFRVILFYGNFFSDGWDNHRIMTKERNNLIVDKYLIYLRRINGDKDIFRNAFGTRYVHYPGTYKWWLQIDKIRNKGINTDTFEGDIIVGVMNARGILPNIGAPFFSYGDGFGWTENGYIVNNGKFKEFGHGFKNKQVVEITLEWDRNNESCKLLFNGWKAFQLNPNKSYKLAVALRTESHRLKWIKFGHYDI